MSSLSFDEVNKIICASASNEDVHAGIEDGQENFVPWFMLWPDSLIPLFRDFLAMIFLCYDILMMPLVMANLLDLDTATFWIDALDLVIPTFWTCSIVLRFFTGYRQSDTFEMEMRPWPVARYYQRSWFGPDLAMVVVDWTVYGMQAPMSGVADIGRIVRVTRISRAFKLVTLSDAFMQRIQGDSKRSLLQVCIWLFRIITTLHWVACMWCLVGRASKKALGTLSWTDKLAPDQLYVAALHWAVAQVTPAQNKVQPENSLEQAFAICVGFLGWLLFSFPTSRITAWMTQMQLKRYPETQTKAAVLRYLSEKKICRRLASKIMDFLRSQKFKSPRPVLREDIAILATLPRRMQLKLDWEVNEAVLARHPVLRHVGRTSDRNMLQMCTLAKELSLARYEELFTPGTVAASTYFPVSGDLRCFHGFSEDEPWEIACARHRWLCEPALWVRWKHRGRAVAETECSLVSLSGDALHRVVITCPGLRRACRAYARLLCDELKARVTVSSMPQQQRQSDMSGDFGDDMDRVLELAEACLETVQEGAGLAKGMSSLLANGRMATWLQRACTY